MARAAPSNKWVAVVIILVPLFLASITIASIIAFISGISLPEGNVATIKINGVILPEAAGGPLSSAIASSSAITELLDEAEENLAVEAILLEINSPGGSAVASEEIMQKVRDIEKPTIALIRDSGTSGAYWVASASDWVIASPVSITGSIGVTASYLEFGGLISKYGIGYERLVSGEFKDIGSPFRNLTDGERAELQSIVDEMRDYFVSTVAENRGLENAFVDEVATGLIYTGSKAKELQLVDELGGKKEVEEALKRIANLTDVEFTEYEKKPSFFDLATGFLSGNAFELGRGIGSALVQSARKPFGIFF